MPTSSRTSPRVTAGPRHVRWPCADTNSLHLGVHGWMDGCTCVYAYIRGQSRLPGVPRLDRPRALGPQPANDISLRRDRPWWRVRTSARSVSGGPGLGGGLSVPRQPVRARSRRLSTGTHTAAGPGMPDRRIPEPCARRLHPDAGGAVDALITQSTQNEQPRRELSCGPRSDGAAVRALSPCNGVQVPMGLTRWGDFVSLSVSGRRRQRHETKRRRPGISSRWRRLGRGRGVTKRTARAPRATRTARTPGARPGWHRLGYRRRGGPPIRSSGVRVQVTAFASPSPSPSPGADSARLFDVYGDETFCAR